MKIWYVRYHDDNPDEDGIWFTDAREGNQFFVSQEEAQSEVQRRNDKRREQWLASQAKTQDIWEETDLAYGLLEREGFDPRKVFPYHNRNRVVAPFKDTFVLDWFEVKE